MKKLFSIVIPIYKSEENLPVTVPFIMEQIPVLFPTYHVELILVNDGSPDNSWELMKQYQKQYPDTIRIARFTRNFGQTMAIHYGVSIAKGDAVGVISADLQDPFMLFQDMLGEWEKGAELVCGIREGRDEKGLNVLFSKITHRLIHRFITNQYPVGGFDFFLMDRHVARRYAEVKERNGSSQVLLLSMGARTVFLPYTRQKREIGKSSWTFSKKIKYFLDTFVTNTYLPMRVMSVGGVICAVIAFIYAIFIVAGTIVWGTQVPGWSSLAALVTMLSGLLLVSLGIIGEYLWRIYDAVKGRPLYYVDEQIETINVEKGDEK